MFKVIFEIGNLKNIRGVIRSSLCVCVCVCVRERERERGDDDDDDDDNISPFSHLLFTH